MNKLVTYRPQLPYFIMIMLKCKERIVLGKKNNGQAYQNNHYILCDDAACFCRHIQHFVSAAARYIKWALSITKAAGQ